MHGAPNPSVSATNESAASNLSPSADRAVLVVSRERNGPALGCSHRVSLDGQALADLRPGGWVTAYPRPGEHVVAVAAIGAGCSGRSEVPLQLMQNDERALRTIADGEGRVGIVATKR